MPTVSALVDEISAGGAFDVDSTVILAWLDRRHKEMVAYARAYRGRIAFGNTVAGTAEYNTPAGIVELSDLTVGGETYVDGRHTDIAAIQNGWLILDGPGGLVIESAAAGLPAVSTLAIIPTPTASGLPIVGFGAIKPPDLLIDDTVPIRVDDDFLDGLIAGVYATGLMQPKEARPDLAGPQLQLLQQAKDDFRSRVRRRLRGAGPSRIRIAGLNA